ncbi:methyltransferase domain-containing protein [Methanolobus sp. ZRKC2]|uniref:class I SAM-dependent methyltransferase n=1 Tax=Methanolobus sp. ZRKC2 TaxID=3125783 RepID=UPI0032445A67
MSVISKYNRYSYVYDLMDYPTEVAWYSKWRKEFLSGLSGRVLEIGVGTGKNLPYYPTDSEVVGIDISKKMLEHAKTRAEGRDNISLFLMDAENLGFKDNTFNYVVTTFVLCSIPDPVAALKEMRRLCRSDGEVINIEHMKSDNRLISSLEDVFDPLTTGLADIHINRKTIENIKKAGLTVTEVKNLALKDVFRLVRSKP